MLKTLFGGAAIILVCGAPQLGSAAEPKPEPIDVGSRREMFVDDYLIDRIEKARRVLHHPTPREISLVRNKPWEGNASGYTTVLQDGDWYRVYYRGTHVPGTLWIASRKDGTKQAECELPASPVLDGAALTDCGVFLTTLDGTAVGLRSGK